MDDTTEEMGKVLLLYPSIVNNIISHGRATELLGMENDVYDLAYDYGLEHDVTISVNIKIRSILITGWEHCHIARKWMDCQ